MGMERRRLRVCAETLVVAKEVAGFLIGTLDILAGRLVSLAVVKCNLYSAAAD